MEEKKPYKTGISIFWKLCDKHTTDHLRDTVVAYDFTDFIVKRCGE